MAPKVALMDRIQYDSQNHCWNWNGARNRQGYGRTTYKGHHIYAHRLSAILWLKFDPASGLRVLHKCDNPSCFSPHHLFLGTLSDNTKDALKKGRIVPFYRGVTHCKRGHEYTAENTYHYTYRGQKRRRCRICKTLLNNYGSSAKIPQETPVP